MTTTYPCGTCGSESATSDYCDVCGTPIASRPPEPVAVAAEPGPAEAGTCYFCGAPRAADAELCDICGLDFVSREEPMPLPPTADPTPVPPVPLVADEIVSDDMASPDLAPDLPSAVPEPPTPEPVAWIAIVSADRAFFDGNVTAGVVTFPEGTTPAQVALDGGEVSIGRHSESLGYVPDIDLSAPVDDPAVSRRHAVLRQQADGSWTVIDVGSTNGTWLNDDDEPLAQGVPRILHDGDRILLGAFTCITIRRA